MVSTGHFLGLRCWETKAKRYKDSENIYENKYHISCDIVTCEERKTSIKTMDEGLFITESSGISKYDEDKITKLIIVINIYASKIEELACLVQSLRPKWRKVQQYSHSRGF